LLQFVFAAAADNEGVTDQLSLSIWLEPRARAERMRNFEKLLRTFPFSQREQPQSVISIHAIDLTEPPLLERPVNGPLDVAEVLTTFDDYEGDDVAYAVESWWDLWQFNEDWILAPAPVALGCFGPDFDNGTDRQARDQEDLRIDFGTDILFLPVPDVPGRGRLIESNIRSLLRVVHEIDSALPLAKRRLETESGENFAERLQQVLSRDRLD
jgi:hypothetical protein